VKTLIIGYGNELASDDGLGPALVSQLKKSSGISDDGEVETDIEHMLSIDIAGKIRDFDRVFFIDATDDAEVVSFRADPVIYKGKSEFSFHKVTPGTIVAMCSQLYNRSPESVIVKIRGYEWGLSGNLSQRARLNMNEALEYVLLKVKEG